MKEVKKIFYSDKLAQRGTGLILELETGELLRGCSSDLVQSFAKLTASELKILSENE